MIDALGMEATDKVGNRQQKAVSKFTKGTRLFH
jgi:hypothetical protein